MSNGLKKAMVLIAVLAVAGVLLASTIISGYNRVVIMDENVKNNWAQVEVQLKRRFDLIPNLVATVKGYAAHEKGIFEDIAAARVKYFQAGTVKDKIEAANQIEGPLSRLLLLQERYPDLKANENFLKLQDSIEGTENRIAVARKRYNDAVMDLDAYIRTVWGRLYAGLANVGPAPYYQPPQGEEAAPQVKF
ncbi:MAG: LemA family protein [Nitrospiraceae bacterium]|nr:LemA family protein [Nitrospiraceae bacterium]MDA8326590.1 LemA family protein [Nitrospiraceae bacterium]